MSKNEVLILKSNLGEKINSVNDLANCILQVLPLVGIKEAPDKLTIENCWIVFDHFSSFKKQNFIQAFQFNEAMVYEKRHEHFNTFLPAYMSEVLHSYRSMKSRAEIEYKRALASNVVQPPTESGEDCFKSLKKLYSETNQLPRFWNWSKVYLHLEDVGEINLTIEQKKKIIEDVKTEIELKKKRASDLDELKSINELLNQTNLINEARKICVKQYFNNLNKK